VSHTFVGSSSVAPVTRARPPPYGSIWYATTGTFVDTWNAVPMPDPCSAASPTTAGVTPSGQFARTRGSYETGSFSAAGSRDRKSTATSPAGSPSVESYGSYCTFNPCPLTMRVNGSSGSV